MRKTSRRAAGSVGVGFIVLAVLLWVWWPEGNDLLRAAFLAIGISLASEAAGLRAVVLRRSFVLLLPLAFGLAIGIHVSGLPPQQFERALILLSDSYPLLFGMAALLLIAPVTRLAASLADTGSLLWTLGVFAGLWLKSAT